MIVQQSLSFIETSALDSSNVELAFQKILSGTRCILNLVYLLFLTLITEIYREVSKKAIDAGSGAGGSAAAGPAKGKSIKITPTSDTEGKKSGCCK